MFRILMTRLSSKGTCSFCGGSFAKSSMARHLNACEARAKENEKPSVKGAAKGGAKRKILHLQVNARNSPMYWIHIEIPENATLEDLDDFLRLFWLECCSHLSSFEIEGCSFFSERFEQEDRSMKISLGMVIAPGMEFEHIYDFGTSTELSLKVLSAREGLAQGKAVKVMARNEPPDIRRQSCGKPATKVCCQCVCEGTGWMCDECAGKHECREDMLLPVVNSPRVGMCACTGGSYD